jgi:hypothetical protein
MARDNCAEYLSGRQIQKMLSNSFVSPMGGMRFDLLDQHVQELPKPVGPKGVCVFFGGRWVEGKGFSTYLEFMEKAYRSGEKVYGIATTPADEEDRAAELRLQYPMIQFYPNCDRETFYEKLKEGHLFFSFSMWEGFGISYWEMMYQGLVGIFLDRPWNKSVLPETEWPLRFDDTKNMYRQFKALLDPARLREAQVVLDTLARPYLREHYNRAKVNSAIYEWMLTKTRQHYDAQFGGDHAKTFKGLVGTALSRMTKPAPMELAFKMISACATKQGLEFGRRNQFVSRMFLRQCAQFSGYRDLCTVDEPMLAEGSVFSDELSQMVHPEI